MVLGGTGRDNCWNWGGGLELSAGGEDPPLGAAPMLCLGGTYEDGGDCGCGGNFVAPTLSLTVASLLVMPAALGCDD
jgi:hypothetical protein